MNRDGLRRLTASRALRYGAASAMTALALLLALALEPVMDGMIEGSPFSVVLAAVAFSAWYGGLGPGLLATLLGALVGTVFYAPGLSFPGGGSQAFIQQLLVFAIVAVLISTLTAYWRGAQHRAETARADAEAARLRLRDLVNGVGATIWEADPDTLRFTFVSQQAEAMLGFPVEQWLAGPDFWANVIHPQDRAQALAQRRQAMAAAGNDAFEYRVVAADGRVLWLRDIVCVASNGARKAGAGPSQLRGLLLDVTARRQTEAALRESERRFRAIFDATFELIGLLTPDGTLLEANQAALDYIGRTRGEVVGRPFWETPWWSVASEMQERLKQAVDAAAHGRFVRDEVDLVAADGTLGTFDFSLKPVFDDAGQVCLLLSESRDVTERKRVEQAQRFLAQASDRLASSLDYAVTLQSVARLAIPTLSDWCMVDLLEQESSLIHRVAVAHVDPQKEELAREMGRRFPLDGRRAHPVARALRSGKPETVPQVSEEILAHVAQNEEHLKMLRAFDFRSVVVVPLVAQGKILGAISLGMGPQRCCRPPDLALAEELAHRCALALDNARLYRAAQNAVRVRDELLSATSHELRTPLSHIKGFVSSLLQSDVDWDEETRRDFLTEADREADRLTRLIGDLLDMSRIDSGGLDAGTRLSTEPAALVVRGLERVRGLLGERTVEVDVPAGLPAVAVDAAQLERVIANLVENAAKYAPPGSRITIRGASVDGFLELRVEDEGAGIPPEQLEQIFEKFFRGQKSEHSGIPGTGLGLAICRGIVRAHGGRIWAENRTEGGARFVVALPLPATAGSFGQKERPDLPPVTRPTDPYRPG